MNRKIASDFWRKACDWQWLQFSAWHWSQTHRESSESIPGPRRKPQWNTHQSWPDLTVTHTANIQRRALNVLYETWKTVPEDYLKKLQQSLPKRVQVALKNKGDHSEYWLSGLLERYKLYFCLMSFFAFYFHCKILTHECCCICSYKRNKWTEFWVKFRRARYETRFDGQSSDPAEEGNLDDEMKDTYGSWH